MTDDPMGEYLASLRFELNRMASPTGEEIAANIQRLFGRKTLFTSVADAPVVMLGVEADPLIGDRVQVQGHRYLPPGIAFLVEPGYLPSPLPRPVDALMSPDVMDLDANDAYWRPE